MATVNEQIVTGRKFRKLIDEATKLWQRISFWTKASDVEFDDGSTAETKMGAINGITDSLVSTSSNIAASAKALNQLNNKLNQLFNNLFIIRSYTKSSTISAHSQENISFDITVEGYKPVAIYCVTTSNTGVCVVGACIKNNIAVLDSYNTQNTSMNATRQIGILYIKNNLTI